MASTTVAQLTIRVSQPTGFVQPAGRQVTNARVICNLVVALLLVSGMLSLREASGQSPADYQEAQRLATRFTQLFQAGRYPEAYKVAEQTLSFVRQRNLQPAMTVVSYEMLSRSLQSLGR